MFQSSKGANSDCASRNWCFHLGSYQAPLCLFSVLFVERRKQVIHYEETENLKILRLECQLSIQMKLRKSHKLSKQITTYLAIESISSWCRKTGLYMGQTEQRLEGTFILPLPMRRVNPQHFAHLQDPTCVLLPCEMITSWDISRPINKSASGCPH